jgi:hypothetical protein
MQMPGLMPARQVRLDQPLSHGRGAVTLDYNQLSVADDKASCHAACIAGLAAAKLACAALGPFAPPCIVAAEAAFVYCNTRC